MYTKSLQIKNMTIRNRIAIPPMVCFHWTDDDGYVTEKNISHYEDLAKGGAGLIIVEATAITKRGRLHQTELGIWDDSHIEGLKKIVDVIHENGAKTFIQIVHAGGNGIDKNPDTPSDVIYCGETQGISMSTERIQETIQDYVQAALRAKKAGFDGVELHGCHGYLISSFFNSRDNKRTDDYGHDKSLFAKEVLIAVKKACGDDFIVGIRLGVFEPLIEDGINHAKAIAPYTDFMDISYGGNCDASVPDDFSCSPAVYGAMCVKSLLPDMPVFGVHNINSKDDVINALNTGIDMVDIGKASLVDPAFANHIIKNEAYGQCLHCNNFCRWNPNEMANPDLKCPGYVKFHKTV